MKSTTVSLGLALGLALMLTPALRGPASVASERPAPGERKVRLDPEPGERQKGYHPADHQIALVTPPPFIWVPAGRGSKYGLQVSRSESFPAEGTLTFSGLARSVHVPSKPLEPGRWFWRYGVETPQGVTYGRPRPFSVPESARPFPFPDFNEVVARVPRERPRLFFAAPRLEALRKAARGELKEAVQSLVRSARKTVGEKIVEEPGTMPKEGEKRGPWQVNVMRTTRPPMDDMERCALAYLITGERDLGLEAKRRILHFFSWDPEGPTSFFAYDEPPMWVMMRGTRAYDWTYDLFSSEERAKVEGNMKARALQFLKRLESLPFESVPFESHAGRLPGFLGECAISFIHEWPEARGWLEYATLLYATSYPAWGGDDGGWQEGPGYWSSYMSFALHFVAALREAAGIDLMKKPFFRNTPYYGLYTAPPYGEHSPFGDGQGSRPGPRLASVLYAFSSLLKDPYLRWYAEAAGYRPGADVLSLATYDSSVSAKAPVDLPGSRVFPAVGLVSMHAALGSAEDDICFLMRSSPYGSTSHGHADQNAFVIEAFGKGLAIATGYYPWYGSPHHQDWTRATRAVNSILVDGEGQERRSYKASGAITAFSSVQGYDYAEGEAAPAYGGRLERFRRHVVHLRPGIFVIFDDLAGKKDSTFQWLLHAYDKIQVEEGARRLRIERAPAALDAWMLLPEKVTFQQTDRYVPEPEDTKGKWDNTWHLTAGSTVPAKRAAFLVVLAVHRVGDEAGIPRVELAVPGEGAAGVRIESKDGSSDLVIFRTDPAAEAVKCAGLETRGRVLAVGKRKDGAETRRLGVGAD
jgi:hypothetical protein